MLKAIRKYGFWLMIVSLFIFPKITSGQDLGSSNGLFRSPNPTTKKANPGAEKKSAPKTIAAKKTPTRTVAAKSATKRTPAKIVSKQKPVVARTTTVKNQTTGKSLVKNSIQNNVVITVGKPDSEKVEASFERAIEEGNAARDERNYVAAEGAYHRAQNLKPKDSRAVYGLGNIFSDQQRWEEAEKAYRQAIELDPDSPEAHIALSFVLTQPIVGVNLSDRYAEAESTARRAIILDSSNAVAYDQLGVALELRGQIGNGTQNAYRRAIQLDPKFALAYAHLGRLLRRNGLNKESNSAYLDAIRLASDIPTMILVADVMQSQQRYAESEQLLRRALTEDPKNPTALLLLARALTIGEKYDEAEKLLKKSIEVSPNSFVSYTLLGSLYVRLGNFSEAERTLMRALRVVSPNEKKRLAQEFESVGDGLMRAGKKGDAVRVYRQAVLLDAEKVDLSAKLNKAEKS
jgi:tetratricopeptide (TPR) repeat protein